MKLSQDKALSPDGAAVASAAAACVGESSLSADDADCCTRQDKVLSLDGAAVASAAAVYGGEMSGCWRVGAAGAGARAVAVVLAVLCAAVPFVATCEHRWR